VLPSADTAGDGVTAGIALILRNGWRAKLIQPAEASRRSLLPTGLFDQKEDFMSMDEEAGFDAAEEIRQTVERLKKTRQRQYKRNTSKLDRYRMQLVSMHQAGATMLILQQWLKIRHCKVAQSTIWRFLKGV
jgi:hypothetical protein